MLFESRFIIVYVWIIVRRIMCIFQSYTHAQSLISRKPLLWNAMIRVLFVAHKGLRRRLPYILWLYLLYSWTDRNFLLLLLGTAI